MMIERKESLLMEGFGDVTFTHGDYTITMMLNETMRIGKMNHNTPLYAPTADIVSDGKEIKINFNFDLTPVSGENWGKIKGLVDEMMAFYTEFVQQFGDELLDPTEEA